MLEPELFIEQALEGLRLQTAAHTQMWHFGEEANWAADQNSGKLKFTFDDGKIVEADMQIVGTYSLESETFMWGWDHPSIQTPLQEHARLALEFGHTHNLSAYIEQVVACSEDDAWSFTATAARLGGANGAYRGPTGSALVFMTFGEVKLKHS